MLYSYFFDIEKKHRIEMDLEILNFVVIDNHSVAITFNLKISEYVENELINNNNRMGTFNFEDSENNFDIEFDRVRIQDKWYITAINNQHPEQTFSTGLQTQQSNINPLGVDIKNDNKGYTADVKGNTLAILEQSYVPPAI